MVLVKVAGVVDDFPAAVFVFLPAFLAVFRGTGCEVGFLFGEGVVGEEGVGGVPGVEVENSGGVKARQTGFDRKGGRRD